MSKSKHFNGPIRANVKCKSYKVANVDTNTIKYTLTYFRTKLCKAGVINVIIGLTGS